MDYLKTLLCLLTVTSLLACQAEDSPLEPTVSTAAASPVAAPAVAADLPDISGCWRPVGADGVFSQGAEFYIFIEAADAFVIGKDARTKLVVKADRSFNEVNRDEKKPFFPPGFVNSSGFISADLNTIERHFPNDNNPRVYRRCNLVKQELPASIPAEGRPTATPSASEEPTPRITPLMPLRPTPTAAPVASASPVPENTSSDAPVAEAGSASPSAASSAALPSPTATPTPSTAGNDPLNAPLLNTPS